MPSQNPSKLKRFLQQYADPGTRARVLTLVQQTGLQENDPALPLMIGTAQVQALLETGPKDLRQTFEYAHQEVLRRVRSELERYEEAARRGIESTVASSVEMLLKKTARSKAEVTLKSLLGGAAALLGVLALGIVGGLGYDEWRQANTQYVEEAQKLTLEEANALNWALSREGQYAQQIMAWNEDLLGGQCQKQVENLGVTIQYGTRMAESGFCLVWIAPPAQRNFIEAKQ